MDNYLCLSELLEQDISSYEFFQGLPPPIQKELEKQEITTFSELQATATKARQDQPKPLA